MPLRTSRTALCDVSANSREADGAILLAHMVSFVHSLRNASRPHEPCRAGRLRSAMAGSPRRFGPRGKDINTTERCQHTENTNSERG